jgi:hypothetical protein
MEGEPEEVIDAYAEFLDVKKTAVSTMEDV